MNDTRLPSLHPLPATELPSLVAASGPAAQFAWEEFIDGAISNDNTRKAYRRAVCRFLEWCAGLQLELASVTPGHVGRYFTGLTLAPASKKLALTAIRHFFDRCVTRHVVILNPALSVRADRHQVMEGKSPSTRSFWLFRQIWGSRWGGSRCSAGRIEWDPRPIDPKRA